MMPDFRNFRGTGSEPLVGISRRFTYGDVLHQGHWKHDGFVNAQGWGLGSADVTKSTLAELPYSMQLQGTSAANFRLTSRFMGIEI